MSDTPTYPVEVTWRHMDASEHLETEIRQKAATLGRYYKGITRVHVTIEEPLAQKVQHKGGQWHVNVHVEIPGYDVVISHDPGDARKHDDVYQTMRHAFEAARKQLTQRSDKEGGSQRRHQAAR